MPFPADRPPSLPPPDTLTRPTEKWFCSGFRVDERLRAAGLSPDTQPSSPSPTRNYLLARSGCRWLGRASGRWGRGASPRRLPAALPAFMPRAAGSPRAGRGARTHHRAGLGEPWSSGRVQPALRDPARSGPRGWPWPRRSRPRVCRAHPPAGEAPPGPDLDLRVWFLPRKQPRPERSLPRRPPSTTSARAQSSAKGGWVGGSGEALLYQPGSYIFLP